MKKSSTSNRTLYLTAKINPAFFASEFCQIEDPVQRNWIPFRLWPFQIRAIREIQHHRQVIILKARQLGLSWLTISYALWLMLFQPGSSVLIFSKRDLEAENLLSRLKDMHARLPEWLRAHISRNNDHMLDLKIAGKRSTARAFPTTGGRSYTASLVILDEADHIDRLDRVMSAVKPTIDAGGQIIILSTANKEKPDSEFKRLWTTDTYHKIFIPWHAHPDRDQAWYEKAKSDYIEDILFQEYPATPEEALAPAQLAKRFHPSWIQQCHSPARGSTHQIPPWTIYTLPQQDRTYVLSADPAEGNPSSDPSAAIILDDQSWEEVACLHGQYEPDTFANYLIAGAETYNNAIICVERNNHGHAVILAIQHRDKDHLLYINPNDEKPGWLSSKKWKSLAVDHAAQALRAGDVHFHTNKLKEELAIFDARSLSAPAGFHDDMAMALINGLAAIWWKSLYHNFTGESIIIEARDALEEELTW